VNFETGYMFAKGIPILLIGYNIEKHEVEVNFPLYIFLNQENIQFCDYSNNGEDNFIKDIFQKTKKLLNSKQQRIRSSNQINEISIYYPFKFNLSCICVNNNYTKNKEGEYISFFQDYCNNKEFSKIIHEFFNANGVNKIDDSTVLKEDFIKNKIIFLWGSKGYYNDPMYYFLSEVSFYNYNGVFIISYSYVEPQYIPLPLSNFQIFHPSIVEKIGDKIYVREKSEIENQINLLINKIRKLGKINYVDPFGNFYQKLQDVNKSFFSERTLHVATTKNNFIQQIEPM